MTVIMWIDRLLKDRAETACTFRPVVLVAGARQTGKSSLLQRLFQRMLSAAAYVTLDRVIVAAEAEETPSYFLDRFDGQTIIDEIQYAPSLLRELKICIDKFMWLAFVVVEKIMIFVGGSAIAGFLLICLILFAAVI